MFSLTFIFIFLPVSLSLYYVTPNKFKAHILTFISLFYYMSVDYKVLPFVMISLFYDYLSAIYLSGKNGNLMRKMVMILNVFKNIGILLYFSIEFQILGYTSIFGIMFTSFMGMGYVIDVYKNQYNADKNIFRYLSIMMFFPSLYFGPLVKYSFLKPQITKIRPSLSSISKGIVLFISGFAKKIIIADTLVNMYENLLSIPFHELSVLASWLLMLSFAFSLYFTLSAYFDIAKGIGLMFSFELPNGFFYPFQARSLDEFFARFNITVNQYVKNYVYIQLGGKSNGTLSAMFNILLVSMLIGVWYGFRLNCLLWGVYFGILIILEQYAYPKLWKHLPAFLQRFITFCAIMMSFSIMLGTNIGDTAMYLTTMFGFGHMELYDSNTLFIFTSNFVVLLLALVLSTSIWNRITRFFIKRFPVFWELFSAMLNVFILICACSFII